MNHVHEVLSVAGLDRFYEARFPDRKEGICSKSVRNVGASSTFFATTEGKKTKKVGDRPLALRGHVTSFLCKWQLHDFAFEALIVGHLLNKLIVIWSFRPFA